MSSNTPLPKFEQIKDLLFGLLGKPVNIQKGAPIILSPRQRSTVALYKTDQDQTVALCICDFNFVACAGSALALIPPDIAKQTVDSGILANNMLDNFKEVMNVSASFFNKPSSPHVKFIEVHMTPCELPREAYEIIAQPSARIDLEVTIVGYGNGRMSLIIGKT